MADIDSAPANIDAPAGEDSQMEPSQEEGVGAGT